jgi:thiol-disulfide isomerase/thioredoxin
MIRVEKPLALVLVLALAVGGVAYLELTGPDRGGGGGEEIAVANNSSERVQMKQGEYRRARPISSPAGFINADNVSIRDLVDRNEVVLVDFWTYSCINCQRTFPYLNAWHEKYGDEGLTIVGVHAPEFQFEEKRENVEDAVARYGIDYPVVLDNDFATWRNYDNRFWPQKYLVDADGFIRYEHIGEGSYAETERTIQELLIERAHIRGEQVDPVLTSTPVDPDAETADFRRISTPEIYFGSQRNADYLGNGEGGTSGVQELTAPPLDQQTDDLVYLNGSWRFTGEYAEALNAGATIVLEYGAKDVNFVAEGNGSVDVTVRVDGEQPGDAAGDDVARDGTATVENERLYDLVTHDDYGDHRVTITAEEPGLRAYTFTFG